MAEDLDRTDVWDHNKAADGLFGEEGGMAIWVRSEEVAPRAAVRSGSSDLAEVIAELGALKLGLDRLIEATAKRHDMDPKFVGMAMSVAADMIRKKAEPVIRIRSIPTGGE